MISTVIGVFYIFIAIFLLGILITIHELGHFSAARILGVPVQEFAIGFGPKLIKWKSKKYDTKFSLRAIPLGGFCAFYGENDPDYDANLEHPEWALNKYPIWKRMFIILMGPAMNFLLALIVSFGFYFFAGASSPIQILEISSDSPAQIVGLEIHDQIVQIGDTKISKTASIDDVSVIFSNNSTGEEPIDITISREGLIQEFSITPRFESSSNRYIIGISYGVLPSGIKYAPILSFYDSWRLFVHGSKAITGALVAMLTRGEGLDQAAGPIGAISMISEQTQLYGFYGFISLLIMISINLGIFNLLPIPGLDGSRVLFLIAEKLCSLVGIKINKKLETIIHLAGFVLLIGFALFFTYQDILRLFSKP